MIPFLAQVTFVPPDVQDWFIEFVRSKMMTTCAGLGFPPRIDAVALALIVNVSIPSRPAKNVFVGARSCTTTAFTGSQPPSETTHFVVTVVVTASMSACSFLLPGDELNCVGHCCCGRGVRQFLGGCERGSVGGGLQRAARVVRVADVDDECCHPQQHDEHQDHEHDDLTALFLRSRVIPC